MSLMHNLKRENQEITTFRTSSEPHFHWKNHFHRKLLGFGMYADFEANVEIDNSTKGSKTTKIYKQNPVCNGYFINCELNHVFKKWLIWISSKLW